MISFISSYDTTTTTHSPEARVRMPDYPDYYEDYPGPIPIKLADPDSLGQCSTTGLRRIVNISISVNPTREYTDYYEYYSNWVTTIQATAGNVSESYWCARPDLGDNGWNNGGFHGCNDCPMSGLEQQCQVVRKLIFFNNVCSCTLDLVVN